MKFVYLAEQKENAAFARKAAKHFTEDPKSQTYAKGDPEAGELLAIRWNPTTILVVRLDDSFTPLLYLVNQL